MLVGVGITSPGSAGQLCGLRAACRAPLLAFTILVIIFGEIIPKAIGEQVVQAALMASVLLALTGCSPREYGLLLYPQVPAPKVSRDGELALRLLTLLQCQRLWGLPQRVT